MLFLSSSSSVYVFLANPSGRALNFNKEVAINYFCRVMIFMTINLLGFAKSSLVPAKKIISEI